MTLYRSGTNTYLAVLSPTRAVLYDARTGYTSGVGHPQSFVAHCNGAEWAEVAEALAPAGLAAALDALPA